MRACRWLNRPLGRLGPAGVATAALAAAVAVAVISGRDGKFEPRPAELTDKLELRPVALGPGIYLLGQEAPAAVYLVESAAGLVLIDSGLEPNAVSVIRQIRKLGFNEMDLRAILLTHVHADHSQGAAHLQKLSGAKIYASSAEAAILRAGAPRISFLSTYDLPGLRLHPTPVDVELSGDDLIEFQDARFRVIAVAGHTPGSICFLLERPDLRALFTGDMLLHLGAPEVNAFGIHAAYLPPRYGGDARAYLNSLRRLRAMPVPDLVLPGHPQMDLVPQSPRLSERRWQSLLDRGIADMHLLLGRYEKEGAAFLDGEPRQLLTGLHYLGDFGGQALYALATAKGLFLFNAPGNLLAREVILDILASRFKEPDGRPRKLTAVLLTSAQQTARGGLAAIVNATGCSVFAPDLAVELVRRHCPAGSHVHPARDLTELDWFDVQVIRLSGNGIANVAYLVNWAGKRVLVSGPIPLEAAARKLIDAVHGPSGNVAEFLKSLDRLDRLRPNLWLPAVPIQGQNANIYDDRWHRVLEELRERVRNVARH